MMTREEAIGQLRIVYLYDTYEVREAKNMGIEALTKGFYDNEIKPVLGFWQKILDPIQGEHYRCSVCNFYKPGKVKYRYCPNCGAKMMR